MRITAQHKRNISQKQTRMDIMRVDAHVCAMSNKENQTIDSAEAKRTELDRRELARAYVRGVVSLPGWNGARLAAEIGAHPSTINRFLNDPKAKHSLTTDNIIKIRDKSGVPLDPRLARAYNLHAVVAGTGEDRDTDEPSNVREAPQLRPDLDRNEPNRIPVYGTTRGGSEGTFELNTGDVIEWRSRPPQLKDKGEIFGLYVEGDSMAPRYEDGELVLVYRKRPVVPGRDIVIQMKIHADGENPRSYLKRLVSKNSEAITVEQFNPPKKRTIKMSEVESLHLVLDRSEMV
jgi:phage repressor protein C with HTH and peptisase S24 domain